VRFNEPGENRHARQIDHLRAGRNGDIRPDVADLVALDDDDLIRENASGFRIEKASVFIVYFVGDERGLIRALRADLTH